jgi:hypothetical protein
LRRQGQTNLGNPFSLKQRVVGTIGADPTNSNRPTNGSPGLETKMDGLRELIRQYIAANAEFHIEGYHVFSSYRGGVAACAGSVENYSTNHCG